MAVVNRFRPNSMLDVVSTLGGLFSSIMVLLTILFFPFLYSSFNKALIEKI